MSALIQSLSTYMHSMHTNSHSEGSDGQVAQTAFPAVIKLSEPSPLSNLSPVALRGLNTPPAGYPTPCLHPCWNGTAGCEHVRTDPGTVCVKFLCLYVCCLQLLKLYGLVTGPHQSMTKLLSLEPSGFAAEYMAVCACVGGGRHVRVCRQVPEK